MAASRTCVISSPGTGSGFSRRNARAVYMASKRLISIMFSDVLEATSVGSEPLSIAGFFGNQNRNLARERPRQLRAALTKNSRWQQGANGLPSPRGADER